MAQNGKRRTTGGRPKRHSGLDYPRGAEVLANGGSRREVAVAAGSQAASDRQLTKAGSDIVARLRHRGDILQALDRVGLTLDRVLGNIATRMDHRRITRTFDRKGQVVHEFHDADATAQARAVDQYFDLVGLRTLPPPEPDNDRPFAHIPDEVLEAMMANAEAIEATMRETGQIPDNQT